MLDREHFDTLALLGLALDTDISGTQGKGFSNDIKNLHAILRQAVHYIAVGGMSRILLVDYKSTVIIWTKNIKFGPNGPQRKSEQESDKIEELIIQWYHLPSMIIPNPKTNPDVEKYAAPSPLEWHILTPFSTSLVTARLLVTYLVWCGREEFRARKTALLEATAAGAGGARR